MTQAVRFITSTGEVHLGRLDGTVITDAGIAPAIGFDSSESAWHAIAAADGQTFNVDAVELLAPVSPGKVIAIGLNYRSHVEETNLAHPDSPVVFAKFPSSLTGPHANIVIPREETRPDFEGEVGIVIAKRGYRVNADDAWNHVGGFVALNDVSGRRAQLETPMRQFTLGKSFDTFTPVGPAVASVDSVNKDAVDVQTVINGEVMQKGNTRDLIFDIPTLIEYLSRGLTLEPGDIIATGTPGGVGDERKPPRYLRHGDIVEVSVGGVGTIRNTVQQER